MKMKEPITIAFSKEGKSSRGDLARALAAAAKTTADYQGAPTFVYRIGEIAVVNKDGGVGVSDGVGEAQLIELIEALAAAGWTSDFVPGATATPAAEGGDVISIHHPDLDEAAKGRVAAIIASKANLIRASLGIRNLPIDDGDDKTLKFPWFSPDSSTPFVDAARCLLERIVATAIEKKRVTAKEKDSPNPRFAFRIFLVGLGMVGAEFARERRILLSRLSGNSAWRYGEPTHARRLK
jgi:hypothetical protein